MAPCNGWQEYARGCPRPLIYGPSVDMWRRDEPRGRLEDTAFAIRRSPHRRCLHGRGEARQPNATAKPLAHVRTSGSLRLPVQQSAIHSAGGPGSVEASRLTSLARRARPAYRRGISGRPRGSARAARSFRVVLGGADQPCVLQATRNRLVTTAAGDLTGKIPNVRTGQPFRLTRRCFDNPHRPPPSSCQVATMPKNRLGRCRG